MFLPGTYSVDVPVGYYTSVYGLGVAPTDTVFSDGKGVFAEQGCGRFDIGALNTFWRSAENFHSQSAYPWAVGTGMTWAVSQAAPLRNVKIDNNLLLFEYIEQYCCAAGFASGGWSSGVEVGGGVSFGSQQQYMMRSSSAGGFDSPVWNGVFAAVAGAPEAQCGILNETVSGQASISVESSIPLIAEKPYISSSDNGQSFQLLVPGVQTSTAPGVAWTEAGFPDTKAYDFSEVYVTQPTDTAAIINAKLAEGLHIVISPAIYALEDALYVAQENQVVLGLGLATLIAPPNGKPCIVVADVTGVRVAGVLLQAGAWETTGAMLQVGETGEFEGSEANPVVLTDVFARAGGPDDGVGPVDAMVAVRSGYTVIDNTWLWRADHGVSGLVYGGANPVRNGLQVTADNVFAYGLKSEHTLEDNVLWEGDNGLTFFYQAEIMYDYTDPVWDFSCYTLGENVTSHTATGIGCYSFFRDAPVQAPSGLRTNGAKGVAIDKALTVFLNGNDASSINSVVDSDGLAVNANVQVQYVCNE